MRFENGKLRSYANERKIASMKDLESLSASQAAKALSRREIKASDLLLSCLDRIGQRESTVKAWVSLGKENALA